ncbi:Dps family protein [Pseudonocardia sp.]|uniref:Dps family protein n=1 Tax=Pseudonocardia sp. TaxID=60912 RepID=UPI003D0A9891
MTSDTQVRDSQPRLHHNGVEIQPFGKLRDLPIALDQGTRKGSVELLNPILADSLLLYSHYKKYHWLMRGHTFYQLHLLLDKHAAEQLELIDMLAERVQMLGGVAVGDPRHVAELTSVARPPDGAEEVPAMLSRLLETHEIIIGKVREGIVRTEETGEWGTNDLLMGDVLRRHEMQVWFLAEHLDPVPVVS